MCQPIRPTGSPRSWPSAVRMRRSVPTRSTWSSGPPRPSMKCAVKPGMTPDDPGRPRATDTAFAWPPEMPAGSRTPATHSGRTPTTSPTGNGKAGLDRQDRPPPAPRLPAQRRSALRLHRQGRGRQTRARPLAVLGPSLPHPGLRPPRPTHHRGPRQDPRRPRARPVQRPHRVGQHEDPPTHPDRVRLPVGAGTDRTRDAQPRRPPTHPPRPTQPTDQSVEPIRGVRARQDSNLQPLVPWSCCVPGPRRDYVDLRTGCSLGTENLVLGDDVEVIGHQLLNSACPVLCSLIACGSGSSRVQLRVRVLDHHFGELLPESEPQTHPSGVRSRARCTGHAIPRDNLPQLTHDQRRLRPSGASPPAARAPARRTYPPRVSRKNSAGPSGATPELDLSNASQRSRGPSAAQRRPGHD